MVDVIIIGILQLINESRKSLLPILRKSWYNKPEDKALAADFGYLFSNVLC